MTTARIRSRRRSSPTSPGRRGRPAAWDPPRSTATTSAPPRSAGGTSPPGGPRQRTRTVLDRSAIRLVRVGTPARSRRMPCPHRRGSHGRIRRGGLPTRRAPEARELRRAAPHRPRRAGHATATAESRGFLRDGPTPPKTTRRRDPIVGPPGASCRSARRTCRSTSRCAAARVRRAEDDRGGRDPCRRPVAPGTTTNPAEATAARPALDRRRPAAATPPVRRVAGGDEATIVLRLRARGGGLPPGSGSSTCRRAPAPRPRRQDGLPPATSTPTSSSSTSGGAGAASAASRSITTARSSSSSAARRSR